MKRIGKDFEGPLQAAIMQVGTAAVLSAAVRPLQEKETRSAVIKKVTAGLGGQGLQAPAHIVEMAAKAT